MVVYDTWFSGFYYYNLTRVYVVAKSFHNFTFTLLSKIGLTKMIHSATTEYAALKGGNKHI